MLAVLLMHASLTPSPAFVLLQRELRPRNERLDAGFRASSVASIIVGYRPAQVANVMQTVVHNRSKNKIPPTPLAMVAKWGGRASVLSYFVLSYYVSVYNKRAHFKFQ